MKWMSLYIFIEESIKDGAFGISSSLLAPDTHTTDSSILEKMMDIAKRYNAVYSTTFERH